MIPSHLAQHRRDAGAWSKRQSRLPSSAMLCGRVFLFNDALVRWLVLRDIYHEVVKRPGEVVSRSCMYKSPQLPKNRDGASARSSTREGRRRCGTFARVV